MLLILFLLGVVAGSYVNQVAHRVPVGQSLATPPSCPHCHTEFVGVLRVPVVGWVLKKGMCPSCDRSLPVRYPVVELATGVVFVLAARKIGINWILPAYLAFALVSVTLTLTDIDWKRIPNLILFRGGGVAVGLLALGSVLTGNWAALGRGLLGGAVHFVLLFVVALLARGGMGMGDVKLVGLLGVFTAYISWMTLIISIFGGILIGGVVGLLVLVTRRAGRKDEVPFGPPLIVGAWLAILWAPVISPWLFGTTRSAP